MKLAGDFRTYSDNWAEFHKDDIYDREEEMNSPPPLYDPTNPYETEGLSDEVHAMIQFLEDSGIPCVVTSTTDHPVLAKSGNVSRHVQWGTNGKGLAIDTRGMRRGDTDALVIIFYALLRVEGQLHELILSHPDIPFNVRNGRRVPPYATTTHTDHVHASVDRGTFISFPKIVKNTEREVGDMPKDKDYVDACPCYVDGCGGAFSLQFDGGVQSQGDHSGDHFVGSYFSLDQNTRNNPDRRFYSITEQKDGYMILGTDGSYYTFSIT